MLPCCLGKGNFLSQYLSPQMGAGDYHPVQGRRAMTNLNSSRSEALSLVTTYITTYIQQTYWLSWELLLLIMEIRVKGQQFYLLGCHKKLQVRKCLRKLKNCSSQVTKAVIIEGESTSPLCYLSWIYAVH